MYDPKITKAEEISLREPLDIPHHPACIEQFPTGVDCICRDIEEDMAAEASERRHEEDI